MKRIVVALSALAFSSLPAMSETIVGMGSQPCSKWLEMQRTSTAETPAAQNWVLGYVSSSAKLTADRRKIEGFPPNDILRGIENGAILKMVSDACAANTAHTLDQAAALVSAQLIAQPDPVVMAVHREGMSAFATGSINDRRRARPLNGNPINMR
jgi:hypothetical protein